MSDKLSELYIKRIEKFRKRMDDRILGESKVLAAAYLPSENPVPFAERLKDELGWDSISPDLGDTIAV